MTTPAFPWKRVGWSLGVILALFSLSNAWPTQAADKEKPSAGEFKLSRPYTHENLTVFLIHGANQIEGKKILTLQEALEQKKVIVHETGNVGELQIENVSKDAEVFIQSGDIVKGGKQDRIIAFSMIVPAKSEKLPVVSLCVEQGRWKARGKEVASKFSSSMNQLPTKALRLNGGGYGQLGGNLGNGGFQGGFGQLGQFGNQGGRGGQQGQFGNLGGQFGNQGGVWTEVSAFQQKLMKNAGVDARAKESPSSLQLTLENKKVKEAVDKYTQKLGKILEGHKDVIGYAFAINGQLNTAEIYGSADLLKKLWPKLIQANAIEALAELEKDKKFEPLKVDAVKACLLDVEKDTNQRDLVLIQKALTKRIVVRLQETDKTIFLETRDRGHKTAWIHRSYVTK
jgi:hypothetical protein